MGVANARHGRADSGMSVTPFYTHVLLRSMCGSQGISQRWKITGDNKDNRPDESFLTAAAVGEKSVCYNGACAVADSGIMLSGESSVHQR